VWNFTVFLHFDHIYWQVVVKLFIILCFPSYQYTKLKECNEIPNEQRMNFLCIYEKKCANRNFLDRIYEHVIKERFHTKLKHLETRSQLHSVSCGLRNIFIYTWLKLTINYVVYFLVNSVMKKDIYFFLRLIKVAMITLLHFINVSNEKNISLNLFIIFCFCYFLIINIMIKIRELLLYTRKLRCTGNDKDFKVFRRPISTYNIDINKSEHFIWVLEHKIS